MKLFVYDSKSWIFLATQFETIDWYKNNFKQIFDKYEENKNLTLDDNKELCSINGRFLKYSIFMNGEIKIKRSSILEQVVDIIKQYKLEVV